MTDTTRTTRSTRTARTAPAVEDRRAGLAAWALLIVQVVHGLTPADTHTQGYAGLVGGLVLVAATIATLFGRRAGRSWARPLLFGTGLAVALGFVLYHAVPVSSPVTNPYIGHHAGTPAWITVVLSVAAGLWAAYEARPRTTTP
jgi:hypothetical protein